VRKNTDFSFKTSTQAKRADGAVGMWPTALPALQRRVTRRKPIYGCCDCLLAPKRYDSLALTYQRRSTQSWVKISRTQSAAATDAPK
jgi:hypothetical protein